MSSIPGQAQPRRPGRPAGSTRLSSPATGTGADGRPLVPAEGVQAGDTMGILQDVALDLFSRRGFHAVTIKDIAAATGLNASLIYYYFGSKEDLFLSTVQVAVDRAFTQFETLTRGHTAPDQIINDWIETHIAQHELIRKLVEIGLDYAKSGNRVPRIDAAVRQFYERERAVLAATIRDGIACGLFNPVNPEQFSEFISTFLDGAMVRSTLFEDFDASHAIRGLQGFVLSHLRR